MCKLFVHLLLLARRSVGFVYTAKRSTRAVCFSFALFTNFHAIASGARETADGCSRRKPFSWVFLCFECFQRAVSDTFSGVAIVARGCVCPEKLFFLYWSAFSPQLSHFSGTIRGKRVNCSQALGSLSPRHLPQRCG